MKRFQNWSTFFTGVIFSIAIVTGCTRNIAVSPNPVYLNTPTNTSTATNTFTSTPTNAPTPETFAVTNGSSSPANSTQIPGASGIAVLQINANNTGVDPANLTSLTLTAGGSGNDASGISSVSLYVDTNNNGIVDGGDTLLTNGAFSADNGTLTLNFTDNVPAGTSTNLLVVYNFAPGAPAGTYQPMIASNTDLSGTNTVTSGSIVMSGAPVGGAVITIAIPTNTATNTPTDTPLVANTPTNTLTNSPTKTPTNTATKTPTPTITNTPPPGSTATNTPTNSPTNSPSNTATNTPTNSPTNTTLATNTPTPTPTACTSVNFQPTYTFDNNSIDCWQVNGGTSIVTALGISSTTTNGGSAGALQVSINNTSGTISTAQIELNYTVPQNFTGAAITFYVNVDAGLLDLSGYSTGIAVEDQNTGYTGYEANYTGIGGNSGTWIQIIRNTGIVNGSVIQLGIQLYNIPAGASGNLYVDDVQITLAGAPTATPTNTPTGPTNTPTDTPTVGCPMALAAPYNFDSSIGCWSTVNNLTTTTVAWNPSAPAGSISGGGAFDATATYPSGQTNEDFEVALPANTDLTGKVITFNVYVDSAFGGTYGGIQPYVKTGVTTTFCNQPWINIAGFGGWHTYQLILSPPATSCVSVNNLDVRAFGIQVFIGGVPAPATGHIYIDDVTIANYVVPTATPTPNPGLIWTYEDATTQNWGVAVGSPGTPAVAVTNITALNAGASGVNGSTYGLDIVFPAVAIMDYSNNTFQVECNSGPIVGAGMDWVALNLSSVQVHYCWPTSSFGTIYPYVRASGTVHGGTYGSTVDKCSGSCPYVAANTWSTVTLTPSAGAWATEKSNVTAVGVEINLSTLTPFGAFAGGDIVIDNVTLY